MTPSLHDLLHRCHARLSARVCAYEGSRRVDALEVNLDGASAAPVLIERPQNAWSCVIDVVGIPERADALEVRAQFTLLRGTSPQSSVGLSFACANWSTDNYVFMPAAVYAGNRFEAVLGSYSPPFNQPHHYGPEAPIIITDVPRLNVEPGPSRIQQLTGDLATPAMGFYSPAAKSAFLVLTTQATACGDSGLDIEESDDRRTAVFRVTAPGVREETRYWLCHTDHASTDRGADFKPGDQVTLTLRVHAFACDEVQGLFDRFATIRKDLAGPIANHHQLPFSAAWGIQEDKFNKYNWVEKEGYYAVGTQKYKNMWQNWQIGWTGGAISSYPLLMRGDPRSRQRAVRTIDWAIRSQTPFGLFPTPYMLGVWHKERDGGLVRRNGDALYYLLKQILLLERREPGCPTPPHWVEGVRRCAQAFVHLWEKNGQLGFLVDVDTGAITVGGSTSGGIVPAALALAADYLKTPRFLDAAKEIAEFYYRHDVKRGLTTGGPGDALKNPDSESAAGLLESFAQLYESTGDKLWAERGQELARQACSWVVSYDFRWPKGCLFERIGNMFTTGTVYANTQNKHSAPGICTHSGASLFKLFRATGDRWLLELIRDIAHALPQHLSRADRPIGPMLPGWMNERVEMSDWCEPVGEIFHGSCWCETSLMLTYAEIPGLYVQPDTKLICAFDHVDAWVASETDTLLFVGVANSTQFPARLSVFSERSEHTLQPLGHNTLADQADVLVEANVTLEIIFDKATGAMIGPHRHLLRQPPA